MNSVEGKLAAETSSVDVVLSLAGTPGFHELPYLQEVVRVLKPGGDFVAQEPVASEEQQVVAVGINYLDVGCGCET